MVDCLRELGFMVNVALEPDEPCNRTITVYGTSGAVPPGGTEAQPLDLFVGNAGTAARFLAPFLCLGSGVYRLHGVPRMHERPQAALFQALRELGYRVESEKGNDRLPVRIFAGNAGQAPESMTEFIQRKQIAPVPKQCHVSIAESSQFASALLLSSEVGGWDIEIEGENAEESPYVVMTQKLIAVFPKRRLVSNRAGREQRELFLGGLENHSGNRRLSRFARTKNISTRTISSWSRSPREHC